MVSSFLFLILFSRSWGIFCFLAVLPAISRKHSNSVYAKHREVLENTKKSLLSRSPALWNKKILKKASETSFKYKVFRSKKLSKAQIAPSGLFSGRKKNFEIFFWHTLYVSPVFSQPTTWQRQKFQKLPGIPKRPTYCFFGTALSWGRKFRLFLMTPSNGLPKFSHRTEGQR